MSKEKMDKNFENFAILNVLEDGSIVSITSEKMSKNQQKTLDTINICCDNPSYVLKLVLFIEKIFKKI